MMSNKKTWHIRCAVLICVMLVAACAPYHARRKPIHYEASGIASWYGPGFAGHKTANGERYKPSAMTAAHRSLPFGTSVKVTNLDNDKSVVVRINDRGPYVGDRLIDLSKAAAGKIGLIATGTAKVKVVALHVEIPKNAAKEEIEETEKIVKGLTQDQNQEF